MKNFKSDSIYCLLFTLLIMVFCFFYIDICIATSDVSFTYDRLGRIKTVTDAVGKREFGYSSTLDPETETITGLHNVVIRRSYDNFGRNAGFSIEGEDYNVTYGYEKSTGRFNSVGWSMGNISGTLTYSYVPKSDLIHQLKNGDFVITYSYEPHRDLRTRVRNEYGTNLISRYDYGYDGLGRRTSVVRSGHAFSENSFNIFRYNNRSELIQSTRYQGTDISDTGNPIGQEYRAYVYDNIGNRKESTEADDTSIYDTNSVNQYERITGQDETDNFVFDYDGNMISVSDGTSESLYHYDAENRLIAVEPANPSDSNKSVAFLYDYMGRRVRKQVYSCKDGTWGLETEKLFVYDGWHLIRELTLKDGKTSVKSYIWGLDLSQTLHKAGGIGGLLAVVNHSSSEIHYFIYDGNGNVGQLVDSGGNIVARYEYDPYGNIIAIDGVEAEKNPIRFSTKYWDDETGLGYWGRRYHYPRLGRWTNRDPITEMGGINLYTYCLNSPLDLIDPLGLIDSLRAKIFTLIARGNFSEAIALAEAGGLAKLVDKLNSLQPTISSLINKFPVNSLKCDKLAKGIYDTFKAIKANPQFLKITDKYGAQIFFDKNGVKFAETGFHHAVRVGNKVFDALTGPQGMEYSKYVKMLKECCLYPVIQNVDKL